jgi:hypothetical protein
VKKAQNVTLNTFLRTFFCGKSSRNLGDLKKKIAQNKTLVQSALH